MNEAELLFTKILDCDRLDLYLNRGITLNEDTSCFLSQVLKRRIRGEPLQYVLGKAEFMGLEFKVNKDVFIPRPETEILVETAIKFTSYTMPETQPIKILDLATGSGCIGITLAKLLPDAAITATDISHRALKVARENARINNVEDKITFLKSDLFESLPICDTQYAICVCNPPYVATKDLEKLQPELRYEPCIALDGKRDGLYFYRRIVKDSTNYLKKSGYLILEIGFDQKEGVVEIFNNSSYFKIIDLVKDYRGIDRVIVVKRI